jgi:lipopolysaccharide/colanic/teichoic acid biosynthesis glycosyltransferase
MRKQFLWYFSDSVIFFCCFYLLVFFKFGYLVDTDRIFLTSVYIYILWMVISVFTKKQKILQKTRLRDILSDIVVSNIFILAAILVLTRIRPRFIEIRFLLTYLVFLVSIAEFVAGLFIAWYNRIKKRPYQEELEDIENRIKDAGVVPGKGVPWTEQGEKHMGPDQVLSRFIVEETDERVFEFIDKHISADLSTTLILSTRTRFNVVNQPKERYDIIINLKRINDIQYLNKFFETVNGKLTPGGIFIDWVETYSLRKKRILAKYPLGLNYLIYFFDFIFKRVFPKLPVTKNLYFFITQGNNRVLSKAESLGRLYSCGFEIIEETFIGGRLFFVVRKVKEPAFDYHPTYGPVIRLQRLGKDGKTISVYKLRTMHAYSEYLQGYVYQQNFLQEGGKFKNDFRVTTIGRIFRKLWLDEYPMLINLIRGDMKLVGVRPLSRHYFDLYTDELKEKRIRYKPGLIPPFYVDMPKTLHEIMDSEMRYLTLYDRHPFSTDLTYFFKALRNIIFRHARSK